MIIGMLVMSTIYLAWKLFAQMDKQARRKSILLIDITNADDRIRYLGQEVTNPDLISITVGNTTKELLISKSITQFGNRYIIFDTKYLANVIFQDNQNLSLRWYLGKYVTDSKQFLERVFGSFECIVIDDAIINLDSCFFVEALTNRVTVNPVNL